MKRSNSYLLILALLIASGVHSNVWAQTTAVANQNGVPSAAVANSLLKVSLPLKDNSVRFGIIGDTGTGSQKQHQVADVMLEYRKAFPFDFVLMMGDNMYGGESPRDYKLKFEDVYRPLLDMKVKFYASLGNHDEPAQRFYQYFNMDGKEYYRFTKGNAAFYALNSNYLDKKQLQWLESELAKDTSEWKICFFHHPPYSSGGKHGSDKQLREVVEPIFVKYGVNLVLTGHDHFYERIKPQKGIYYFVSGAGGKLRSGDVRDNSSITDKAFDRDMSFMVAEIVGDQFYFQTVSRTGETVDSGVLTNQRKKP
ncbi:MAG TPA: metallophosphoesterase [Pyrinomonadaceae bacterium]|nr:metallophosphoesterase [Pyrinomonadaceae bacterium]